MRMARETHTNTNTSIVMDHYTEKKKKKKKIFLLGIIALFPVKISKNLKFDALKMHFLYKKNDIRYLSCFLG